MSASRRRQHRSNSATSPQDERSRFQTHLSVRINEQINQIVRMIHGARNQYVELAMEYAVTHIQPAYGLSSGYATERVDEYFDMFLRNFLDVCVDETSSTHRIDIDTSSSDNERTPSGTQSGDDENDEEEGVITANPVVDLRLSSFRTRHHLK